MIAYKKYLYISDYKNFRL